MRIVYVWFCLSDKDKWIRTYVGPPRVDDLCPARQSVGISVRDSILRGLKVSYEGAAVECRSLASVTHYLHKTCDVVATAVKLSKRLVHNRGVEARFSAVIGSTTDTDWQTNNNETATKYIFDWVLQGETVV